jgi:hypothetical protein
LYKSIGSKDPKSQELKNLNPPKDPKNLELKNLNPPKDPKSLELKNLNPPKDPKNLSPPKALNQPKPTIRPKWRTGEEEAKLCNRQCHNQLMLSIKN